MVKWRKERIGERSYRPILNTSHQLQMKIVFGIPYYDFWLLATHKHALTCCVCQCRAQYLFSGYLHGPVQFFFTMCCIVHDGFMGMCKGRHD